MLGKFVSINICIKEKDGKMYLLNPTETPLIYWWNPEENFIDSLFREQSLKEYLYYLCTEDEDSYIYENAKLYWFYLEDEETEEYLTKKLPLQEIFPVTILHKEMYYKYFLDILKELYEDVYKKSYESEIEDLDEQVRDIYNKIISGVKRTILLETVSNYLYKTIKERTPLTNENIHTLVKIFNNIIERTQ